MISRGVSCSNGYCHFLLLFHNSQVKFGYDQWRMQDGDKGGLNNEDLGLELEINGDLRLSNRGLMKKSGSLGGL